MCIVAICSRRNLESSKKQKIIDIRKDVSCDTSFLVGWCVKERKSCGANTGTEDCRTNVGQDIRKHLHEYLGENLIILFAQPHFRNLLFRILNEDFIVRSVAHKKH